MIKEVNILTVDFLNEKPIESEHLINEGLIIDYDKNNDIVGIEILDWSKKRTVNLPLKIEQIKYLIFLLCAFAFVNLQFLAFILA